MLSKIMHNINNIHIISGILKPSLLFNQKNISSDFIYLMDGYFSPLRQTAKTWKLNISRINKISTIWSLPGSDFKIISSARISELWELWFSHSRQKAIFSLHIWIESSKLYSQFVDSIIIGTYLSLILC